MGRLAESPALADGPAAVTAVVETPYPDQSDESRDEISGERQEATEPAPPALEENESPPDLEVRFHPDGPLYVGDRVSIEVIPAGDTRLSELEDIQVEVRLGEDGEETGMAGFKPFGIGGRTQATLKWIWDTSDLPAGEHTLSFSLEPDGAAWTETVVLLPAGQVPSPEPEGALDAGGKRVLHLSLHLRHRGAPRPGGADRAG